MKTTLFILTLLSALLGCNDKNEVFKEIPFTEIGQGFLTGSGDEGIEKSNLVIKTKTEWETLMQKMDSSGNVTDNFTEKDIDFNTDMVIAVFLEVKAYYWEVKINKVENNGHNITVYGSDRPFFAASITPHPFHIVKIPKTEKQIVFNLELTE